MSRVIGVDLGARRIGVAVSDDGEKVATPVATLPRGVDRSGYLVALGHLVSDYGARAVVVGLPLSLSGKAGPAAQSVLAEVEEMRQVLSVPVHTHDERLTTVTATSSLHAAGRGSRRHREVVDQVAASVMLQSWLDGAARR